MMRRAGEVYSTDKQQDQRDGSDARSSELSIPGRNCSARSLELPNHFV